MGLFNRTKPKGRYFEVKGYRFAIGMQFIINLTKRYNAINNCDAAIDDVIRELLGNNKVTISNLENYRIVLMESLNTQAAIEGKELYSDELYNELFDKYGFVFIGEIIYQITTSMVGLLYGEASKEVSEDDTKKKG